MMRLQINGTAAHSTRAARRVPGTCIAPPKPPRRGQILNSTTPVVPRVPEETLNNLRSSIEAQGLASHSTQGMHGVGYHHATLPAEGYVFFMPPLTYIGEGALKAAGKKIASLGFKKAMVVTDKTLVDSGAVQPLLSMLDSMGLSHAVFDEVEPNPTVDQVNRGMQMVNEECCDCLISFGGGSPHDCCKAIGLLVTNGGDVRDYEGLNKAAVPMLPMVAINTTAGTAAEISRAAIITDTERHVKMPLIDWRITPMIAVDDPLLMAGMPPSLAAATGMDALTHAMEAYLATGSNPLTDASALHAIRLIGAYLRESVLERSKKARDMMSYAQCLAGMAFNSAGLGLVHALAHQLGGQYNLPHGVCNAVLLPVVLEYNAAASRELFVDMAEALGAKGPAVEDPDQAVQFVLREVRSLSHDINIPCNLQALGVVNPVDFPLLAENAIHDACGATNPRPVTAASKADLEELLHKAYVQ